MGYLEKWKMRKTQEEAIYKVERTKEDRVKEEQKEEMISVLIADFGLQRGDIHTNGYWFQFHYKGLLIDFVNQRDRLCVTIHRPPSNRDEERCLRDAIFIRHSDEFPKFQKEFNYRNAVINDPPVIALRKIMELAELPLEKVGQWIHEMERKNYGRVHF